MIEWIKTVMLFMMIITSMVLTWFLWTYQPEYETLDDPSRSYIEIEDIGDSRSLFELIFPREILTHQEDDVDLLLAGNGLYEEILEEIMDTEFHYVTERAGNLAPHPDHRFTGLEVVFQEPLPADIVYDILDFEDESLPFSGLDRMRIVENPSRIGSDVVAQFVDMNEETVYETDTDMGLGLLEELIAEGSEEQRLPADRFVFTGGEDDEFQNVRYLPSERFLMERVTYETIDLPVQSFRQVLFADPEFVKNYYQDSERRSYTDGNRMLDIVAGDMLLEFRQPESYERTDQVTPSVIDGARQYINGHSGWTDQYYWNGTSEADDHEEVSFRLHVNQLPVLSGNVPSEDHFMYRLRRSGSQFTEYTRPLFQLADEPFETEAAVELQGSMQLFNQIEEYETFQLSEVTDIRLGYHMNRHRSFAIFEPVWYAEVRGRWMELQNLTPDPSGGMTIGLE